MKTDYSIREILEAINDLQNIKKTKRKKNVRDRRSVKLPLSRSQRRPKRIPGKS